MSLSDLTGRYSRQSSAKRRTFEVRLLGRSFMYSRKKRGPSTVPCGTPEVTWMGVDADPFITTCWVLSVRKLSIHDDIGPVMP